MQPPSNDLRSTPSLNAGHDQPDLIAVLLSRDLIFATKIRETAAELGYNVLQAQTEATARSLIEARQPQVVFVDLTAGDAVAPTALRTYRQLVQRGAWFVAFGPHVEKKTLDAARTAGCEVVISRSRLVTDLLPLLRQYRLMLSGATALAHGERAQAPVQEHNATPLPRQAAE
jgi:hypothetical protein